MRPLLSLPVLLLFLAAPALAQSPTDRVFERLNEVRAANGLPALQHDERLDRAAAAHTAEMATLASLFHVSETTGSPLDRVHGAGIESSDISENVAMHDDAMTAQASLEASPSHLANMLGPSFTHVGIGIVATSSGTYVTELFAHLEGATPPAVADAPAATSPVAPTTGVAPPVSSPGSGGSIASLDVPATPAPTAPTTTAPASDGSVVVPPSPTGTVMVPSPAPGVTGYWICANQRWYYYPAPAGAAGGTRLTADTSVTGPPPGHTSEECMVAAPGGPTGYSPPPTTGTPPAPPPSRGGGIIRVEPGRIITPWGTIRTR